MDWGVEWKLSSSPFGSVQAQRKNSLSLFINKLITAIETSKFHVKMASWPETTRCLKVWLILNSSNAPLNSKLLVTQQTYQLAEHATVQIQMSTLLQAAELNSFSSLCSEIVSNNIHKVARFKPNGRVGSAVVESVQLLTIKHLVESTKWKSMVKFGGFTANTYSVFGHLELKTWKLTINWAKWTYI